MCHRKRPRICANQRSRAVHCAIQIYQSPIPKKVRIGIHFLKLKNVQILGGNHHYLFITIIITMTEPFNSYMSYSENPAPAAKTYELTEL